MAGGLLPLSRVCGPALPPRGRGGARRARRGRCTKPKAAVNDGDSDEGPRFGAAPAAVGLVGAAAALLLGRWTPLTQGTAARGALPGLPLEAPAISAPPPAVAASAAATVATVAAVALVRTREVAATEGAAAAACLAAGEWHAELAGAKSVLAGAALKAEAAANDADAAARACHGIRHREGAREAAAAAAEAASEARVAARVATLKRSSALKDAIQAGDNAVECIEATIFASYDAAVPPVGQDELDQLIYATEEVRALSRDAAEHALVSAAKALAAASAATTAVAEHAAEKAAATAAKEAARAAAEAAAVESQVVQAKAALAAAEAAEAAAAAKTPAPEPVLSSASTLEAPSLAKDDRARTTVEPLTDALITNVGWAKGKSAKEKNVGAVAGAEPWQEWAPAAVGDTMDSAIFAAQRLRARLEADAEREAEKFAAFAAATPQSAAAAAAPARPADAYTSKTSTVTVSTSSASERSERVVQAVEAARPPAPQPTGIAALTAQLWHALWTAFMALMAGVRAVMDIFTPSGPPPDGGNEGSSGDAPAGSGSSAGRAAPDATPQLVPA